MSDQPPDDAVAPASEPHRARWNKVHMAVLRDELWSPACSDERGWVAPLADPNLAGQITCPLCHTLAMSQGKMEIRRLRVAGEMQSGYDGAGAFYARVEGVTLVCWDDGTVTWET